MADYKNAEGYPDPTAFGAFCAIEKEEKALRAFRPIVYICSPYAGDIESNTAAARRYCRFAVEAELQQDIDRLVDLKKEIMAVVKAVDDMECQTLLELRYLCFKSWEQIAVDMGYNVRHVYRLHDEALLKVTVRKLSRKCH